MKTCTWYDNNTSLLPTPKWICLFVCATPCMRHGAYTQMRSRLVYYIVIKHPPLHPRLHTHTRMHARAHMHTFMRACTHTHAHTHDHTHTHTHTHTHAHTCAHSHTFSLSLSHTHTHTQTLSLSFSHAHSLSFSGSGGHFHFCQNGIPPVYATTKNKHPPSWIYFPSSNSALNIECAFKTKASVAVMSCFVVMVRWSRLRLHY